MAKRSTHARIHKRESSSGSTHNTKSVPTAEVAWNNSYIDETWHTNTGAGLATPKPAKIKPYLRKLSTKNDSTTLDLSRPAAENETLAGLGINDIGIGSPRTVSDVTFTSTRTKHSRSTSNTSQFSNSSTPRHSQQYYVHPMRQTPRPYTPPSHSYANSTADCEEASEAHDVVFADAVRTRPTLESSRHSGSISSGSVPLTVSVLTTSNSFTGLNKTQSQSSLNMVSPISTRQRTDTLQSIGSMATSPISRRSLDKFSFSRGRDSPIDPVVRQNEIRLARQAYKEKEDAKDRKIQEEAQKQAEREARKMERKEERHRQKEDAAVRKSMGSQNEKGNSSVLGREYEDHVRSHERSMPNRVDTGRAPTRTYSSPDISKTKKARSRWMSFIVWLRTRLLRMGHQTRPR